MRKIIALGIMLLFLVMTISSTTGIHLEKQTLMPLSKGNILYVGGNGPGNYSRIQDAIDNASDGDTVFVFNGTYGLNPYAIIVYKSINLIGENKVNTIINGSDLLVNVSEVLISGFTLQNQSGITVTPSFSFNTTDEIIFPNNITITDNILNNIPGIMMLISNNSAVTNNTFINCGLMLWGYNNFVYNNTVNGKPLVYLESTSDKVIDYAGQVILTNCTNITINNLEISKVDFGIQLYECTNCFVKSNVFSSSNFAGLFLADSNSNTISGNIFINNSIFGLLLLAGENNNISGNHFESGLWNINVGLADSNNNLFSKNNFIFNLSFFRIMNFSSIIPIFFFTFIGKRSIFSIDSDNKWEGNYWNRARVLPVFIWGTKLIKLFNYHNIPWLDVDWHPAKEPYDIEV